MWLMIKRLSLGVVLIVLGSSVLLISDWNQRKPVKQKLRRVAIMQSASQTILDDGVQGMRDALAQGGYIEGQNIAIQRFNAEGDMATVNAIARQITSDKYDLVLTASTLCLQAVAAANKAGKVIHVFGLVTDPAGAGVGISRDNPLDHPKYLAGAGTMQPVGEAFQVAKKMFPGLQSVGVAWNASEVNSEKQVLVAREVCRQLGIKLVEVNVDSSSAVFEAAGSLIGRGVQAIWVGGDVTVMVALESVVAAANKARIPVFTNSPPDAQKGALFSLGADYHEVGRIVGNIAVQVLNGTDPATIPIENVMPEQLFINKEALNDLKDSWKVPDDLLARADALIDQSGIHAKAAANPQGPPARKWKVRVIEYNNVLDVEESEKGVMAGLQEAGLVEGRDYEIKIQNAQGDMATVNGLVDNAVSSGSDLLITMSTPTLQAAIQRVRSIPIVFTYLASAQAAGAGRSDTEHLPNVTGVYTSAAYVEGMALLREVFPHARTVGTLFVPSESNMVYHKGQLEQAGRNAGIEVVALPANTSSEVPDAAAALCSRKIDAVFQIPGNLTAASFPSIASAATKAKIPILAFQSAQAKTGALIVLARDYSDAGQDAARIAARIMRGESPARIPFEAYRKTRLIVNLEAARALGFTLPPDLVKRAEEVIGK